LKIIATGLTGLHTKDLEQYLKDYFAAEEVERVIIGHPTNWDDSDTHATPLVQAFINRFVKVFPNIPIEKVDERYTSKMAVQSMVESGMKKKKRQDKKMVDEIAAIIMLQEYLQRQ
jgi:putative holliday junction resolvase